MAGISIPSGDGVVRVSCALVDAVHLSRGSNVPIAAYVGRKEGEEQLIVAGVGPLGARITAGPELLPASFNGSAVEHVLLLFYLTPLIAALTDAGIRLGDRVLISGSGLTGQLAAQVAGMCTGVQPRVVARDEVEAIAAMDSQSHDRGAERERDVDVLIETTADPHVWPQRLPRVRRMGQVIFLIPPGPQLHPFDFYRGIHKGSFRMRARRVPAVPVGQSGNGDRFPLHLLETDQINADGLYEEIHLAPSDAVDRMIPSPTTRAGLLFRFAE